MTIVVNSNHRFWPSFSSARTNKQPSCYLGGHVTAGLPNLSMQRRRPVNGSCGQFLFWVASRRVLKDFFCGMGQNVKPGELIKFVYLRNFWGTHTSTDVSMAQVGL